MVHIPSRTRSGCESPTRRFFGRVRKRGECWVWGGAKSHSGYGHFGFNGRIVLAHRWIWMRRRGPIPEGLVIDHLCRNRACVNPSHLRVCTQKENILAGEAPSAKYARGWRPPVCKHGHELNEETTFQTPSDIKLGKRRCRACHNRRSREYRAKKRSSSSSTAG